MDLSNLRRKSGNFFMRREWTSWVRERKIMMTFAEVIWEVVNMRIMCNYLAFNWSHMHDSHECAWGFDCVRFWVNFKRIESPGKGQNHWRNFTYEPETKSWKQAVPLLARLNEFWLHNKRDLLKLRKRKIAENCRCNCNVCLMAFSFRLSSLDWSTENVFWTTRKWFNFVCDCSDMNLSIESVSMRCHMSRRNQHKLAVVCCDSYRRH